MIDTEARQTLAWSMFTARAQNYEWTPSDHGGLKQEEVAAGLRGLFEPELSAGLLCKAAMWSKEKEVKVNLFRWTYSTACLELWDLPHGPAPLEKLVVLALFEETGPSVVCSRCDGTGSSSRPWKAGERRSCQFCEGRGRLPRLEKPRWALIGIGETNWSRTWRSRYAAVYGTLTRWVQTADDHLRVHLNRESRDRRNFG